MSDDNPLAGLLKIRTWQRDQSAAAVVCTTRDIQQLTDRIYRLHVDIQKWSQQRRELQTGIVKLQHWRDNEDYRLDLIDQKNSLLVALEDLEDRLQAERSILLEHETDLKRIKVVIEHAQLAKKAKEHSCEQSLLDEWAGVQARISRMTRP
jgi:flagellar export protein FliJ